MNWAQTCYGLVGDHRAEAWLLARAWLAASERGDAALLSNLHCNMLTPSGVCMMLDSAGLPLPDGLHDSLNAWRARPA